MDVTDWDCEDRDEAEDIDEIDESEIEVGEDSQSWIAVETKLPDFDEQVLVIDDYGEMYIDWLESFPNGAEWSGDRSTIPTHWRPLPSPPRKVGEK